MNHFTPELNQVDFNLFYFQKKFSFLFEPQFHFSGVQWLDQREPGQDRSRWCNCPILFHTWCWVLRGILLVFRDNFLLFLTSKFNFSNCVFLADRQQGWGGQETISSSWSWLIWFQWFLGKVVCWIWQGADIYHHIWLQNEPTNISDVFNFMRSGIHENI